MDKDLSFVQLKRTDTNIQFTVFAFYQPPSRPRDLKEFFYSFIVSLISITINFFHKSKMIISNKSN